MTIRDDDALEDRPACEIDACVESPAEGSVFVLRIPNGAQRQALLRISLAVMRRARTSGSPIRRPRLRSPTP